ncbi:LacI family DNA-binding transcriptional regulator [Intestinibacter sp.]
MNDVAKRAGVSRGTVSNYINNVKIKESSRIKIEEAIKELGYIPNVAARELKTKTASNVVFILPTVWNPFFSQLTYYLQIELKKIGKKMLLCNSQNDYISEIEYIEMAKQNKVYGIISVSYSNILPYLTENLPYVAIERYYNESIPYLTSDNLNGSKIAVNELYKRKCNNLLHVTRKIENNAALNDRKVGFESKCKELNLNYAIFNCNCTSSEFRNEVNKFIKESYSKGIKFDGIFCATDRYAQYVVDALDEAKIKVPDDVQIIGFDGVKSHPNEHLKISTIKQDVEKLAIEAVNTLQLIVNKNEVIASQILPVSFLQLETTKKL